MKYVSKKLYAFPVIALMISLIAYPHLPDQIPIHFDFNGNPDNYSGKLFVLMIPIIMAALLVLADFLPKADPAGDPTARRSSIPAVPQIPGIAPPPVVLPPPWTDS